MAKIKVQMTPELIDKLEQVMKTGFSERDQRLYENLLFPAINDWRTMFKHCKADIVPKTG